MATPVPPKDRDGFEIAIVCALKLERNAVEALLEVDFREQGRTYGKVAQDRNTYTPGVFGGKAVVLAYPSAMGNLNAASVAGDMRHSFRNIKMTLVVGVAGGAPRTPSGVDILLGDVVISTAVIQYDFGRLYPDSFRRKREVENTLGRANAEVANFVAYLEGYRVSNRITTKMNNYNRDISFAPAFAHPGLNQDCLYPSEYRHKHHNSGMCHICGICLSWNDPVCAAAETAGCDELGCDRSMAIYRKTDAVRPAKLHFGRVASGNGVIKSAFHCDKLAEKEEVIAFEMEGAGTWDQMPTVIVKSICDYADSHKNKAWQSYAAATAAACAKAILEEWEISDRPDRSISPMADHTEDALRSHARYDSRNMTQLQRRSQNPTTQPAVDPPTHSFVYLAFPRNHRFVGRANDLAAIDRKLFVNQDCTQLAIVGLGGIGKSQIALSFAYSVKESRPEFSIFWVPALNMQSFEQACMAIAKAVGIDPLASNESDVKQVVCRYLSSEESGRWLLVVDNADDMNLIEGSEAVPGLREYLPESGLGLTLFTTRDYEVAQTLAGKDVIEIEKMNSQEARSLFERHVNRNELINPGPETTALLDRLDHLPLAITQAAAYLDINRVTASEYLGLLSNTEQDMVEILSVEMRDRTRYRQSSNAVATTWKISFQQIVNSDAVAAELLHYIACIEWDAIPYSILPQAFPEATQARMTRAVGRLCSYSFLERRYGETYFDMHRLVHLAVRIWLRKEDMYMMAARKAISHLARIFPSDDYSNRGLWRAYMPHVARVCGDTSFENIKGKVRLCRRVGRCLRADGRTRDAVLWLKDSCHWAYRASFGRKHRSRLASEYALAVAYKSNGQAKEAVRLLEHVLTLYKEMFAEGHPDRLATQHALAGAYQADGQS